MGTPDCPLPEVPPDFKRKLELYFEFWSSLEEGGDYGAANWEDLVLLRDQITTALSERPPNFYIAEPLMAKAMLLIDGRLNA